MVFWFFGLPGSGKDYCAKLTAKLLKGKYIHVDDYLTKSDKEKIVGGSFTVDERLEVVKKAADEIKNLLKTNKNVIAAFTLPDHKTRDYLKNFFKDNIVFIFVKVKHEVIRVRLRRRKAHFLRDNFLFEWIKLYWQEPIKIPHIKLENNEDGDEVLTKKLKKIASERPGF